MDLHPDVLANFSQWYADAEQHEPRVPDAIQVATVGPDGRPSLRTVLLKHFDSQGFIFYTNLESRKGRELSQAPWVAATLHWKSLERQVHIEGPVEPVSSETADAYFASRARGSQIGAWASQQSRPLTDRTLLEDAVAATESAYADQTVPRPPHWSGFRIRPVRVEFWQGMPSRLHERVVYTHDGSQWQRGLLYP